MTKDEVSFAEWHKELCKVATRNGGSAADADAWREDYDAGKTPEQSWADEWGE